MRSVAVTVWTNRRKWLGNLIPALVWLPPAAIGMAILLQTQDLIGWPLYFLIAATIAGWVAVNFLGLYQNSRMKRQLQLILESKGDSIEDGPFVGFATPRYSSMIDPHEDVGYLRLFPDRISIATETQTVEMLRSSITRIRFRMNVHTIIGLGRWVSVEGESEGKRIRLLIEPREKSTLLGNLRYSTLLAQRLRRWLKS
jgi:hypothetical protein